MKKSRMEDEYMSAKDLVPLLDRSFGWLYYHSRTTDGPIRRLWGVRTRDDGSEQAIALFHVEDAKSWAGEFQKGQNNGKLYPGSLVQERLADPDDLRLIDELELYPKISQAIRVVLRPFRRAATRVAQSSMRQGVTA
jgi:hypothetical protein